MGILTYKGTQFFLDGQPFTVLSGAMHYFRIPRDYWYDRLLKLKECGFNTVETYTCWNLHEPQEGVFDFSGNLDIAAYVQTAEDVGLHVILRPGPYICAEWEFGGLPAWLLAYRDMDLRCCDPVYLSKIRRYYEALLQQIKPHMAANGGSIFMLQIENEYGSYGNDHAYLREVANIYKDNGIECLLFTSDGPGYICMEGGALPEHLAVANFGSDPKTHLGKFMRQYRPNAPLMCGEYWCGWFDHWFEKHHVRPPEEIAKDIRDFLELDASFNVYMFHGGTNFGFCNGANYHSQYAPTVTSYDYNAPLSEAGDRTELYYTLRNLLQEKYGNVPELTATETQKAAYGKVTLTEKADLFRNLDRISKPVSVHVPKFMEKIGQDFGYTLYRTVLKGPKESRDLCIGSVHDRAQIFMDGKHRDTLVRWDMPEGGKVNPPLPEMGYGESIALDILVENMGRVNYGYKLMDYKGIEQVNLGGGAGIQHFGWEMYPLDMRDLSALEFEPCSTASETVEPVFYRGYWNIADTPHDTFLRLDTFEKGFVMVNGINIGRFFNSAGPQKTLYVPAPYLRQGQNEILVFSTDGTKELTVEFTDTPDLGV